MLAIASMIEMVCCEQEIVPGRTGWTRPRPGGSQNDVARQPQLASGYHGRQAIRICCILQETCHRRFRKMSAGICARPTKLRLALASGKVRLAGCCLPNAS